MIVVCWLLFDRLLLWLGWVIFWGVCMYCRMVGVCEFCCFSWCWCLIWWVFVVSCCCLDIVYMDVNEWMWIWCGWLCWCWILVLCWDCGVVFVLWLFVCCWGVWNCWFCGLWGRLLFWIGCCCVDSCVCWFVDGEFFCVWCCCVGCCFGKLCICFILCNWGFL